MKITKLKTTKLAIENKSIYHYSLGALKGTNTVLVEIETDEENTPYSDYGGH